MNSTHRPSAMDTRLTKDTRLTVLVVDDELAIRNEIADYLNHKGIGTLTAGSASEALDMMLRDRDISVVLSDIRMPGLDGLDLLKRAKQELAGDMEVILLTGHGGMEEAIQALRLGAYDFLQKPINLKHLLHVIERAVERVELRYIQNMYQQCLKLELTQKTHAIDRLVDQLTLAHEEALSCLAAAAEHKDEVTGKHVLRIGRYAACIARHLGWSSDRQRQIEMAAPLHDTGKIGTPDAILLKPGKLDAREFSQMREHTEIGYQILSRMNDQVMRCAADIARSHHEHWDGSGYPRGLVGKEIPIEARITTLCDVYDALRSARPYKPAFSHEEARKIICTGDGRTKPQHFDPELLRIFADRHKEFDRIYIEFRDEDG